MFINLWNKYSKQQCHLHYKEMKGMFESCCGEFSHCGTSWQLFWKFLEVSEFPMQLSLNSVVLNMCSHFLNLTKLGETKNPWPKKHLCHRCFFFFPHTKSLIFVKCWILAERKEKKFLIFKKITGKVGFFWRFNSKQITQQN